MVSLLPDCRAITPRAVRRSIVGSWDPVFCANCGADGGYVPQENITFLFYLCNACAETYGQIAGTMMMPDEVFFERLAQEQLEKYGKYLTIEEWGRISEDVSHPFHKLLMTRKEM